MDTIKGNMEVWSQYHYLSRVVRKNRLFAYAKTKTQISFAVIAKLISVFVFATQIVQSIHFLNPKIQALVIFCDCAARFVSDLVGSPEDLFSHNEAHFIIPFKDSQRDNHISGFYLVRVYAVRMQNARLLNCHVSV